MATTICFNKIAPSLNCKPHAVLDVIPCFNVTVISFAGEFDDTVYHMFDMLYWQLGN